MASFSDDENLFEIDSILQQRKRKGVLEYLVRWKETSDSPVKGTTWEPADNIKADCAQAVETFEKTLKTKSKRSSSRSRKTSSASRSRSRSSSRSRKTRQSNRKTTTRSRSRGRVEDSSGKKTEIAKAGGEPVAQEKASALSSSSTQKPKEAKKQEIVVEKKVQASTNNSSSSARVLRSSTMEDREKLEVQRVHNEQRPVREDDKTPRSAIWKIADYAVIVLFIISALAALFMFIEKFVDLKDFKNQFLPSLSVLQGRLSHVKERLIQLYSTGIEKGSDMWLQLLDQI